MLQEMAVNGLMSGAGATMQGLGSWLQKPGKWKKNALLTPEQQQSAQFARTQGQQQIQNPYQGFEPIAQQAQQMFQKQTVPSLAERFTSMGAGNALSSPAFANQLGAAGQDLSSNLAAMMAQYGQHQQALGQGLMGMGMHPEFENYYQPPRTGFLSGLLGGAGSSLSSMGGAGMAKSLGNWQDKQEGNDLDSILAKFQKYNSPTPPPMAYGSGWNPFMAQPIQGR